MKGKRAVSFIYWIMSFFIEMSVYFSFFLIFWGHKSETGFKDFEAVANRNCLWKNSERVKKKLTHVSTPSTIQYIV